MSSKRVIYCLAVTTALLGTLHFCPSPAIAKTLSPSVTPYAITPRANFDSVTDTYHSFTGIAGGVALKNYIYSTTYKQLSFRNGYSQNASTLLDSFAVGPSSAYGTERIGSYGNGIGSVEIWKCNYTTW